MATCASIAGCANAVELSSGFRKQNEARVSKNNCRMQNLSQRLDPTKENPAQTAHPTVRPILKDTKNGTCKIVDHEGRSRCGGLGHCTVSGLLVASQVN